MLARDKGTVPMPGRSFLGQSVAIGALVMLRFVELWGYPPGTAVTLRDVAVSEDPVVARFER